MKKGDTVNIYEDPITQRKLEEQATLRKLVKDDGDQELWEVKFLGCPGDPVVMRWIQKGGKIT